MLRRAAAEYEWSPPPNAKDGWEYDLVDDWVADRSAQSKDGYAKKSNGRLAQELAALLKRQKEDLKWIATPRKYDGSVADGFMLLNALFARRDEQNRPHGLVNPRCKHFIAAARTFKGSERDPGKDILDGARYGVVRNCTRTEWLGLSTTYTT
jgi:hypothetical protein